MRPALRRFDPEFDCFELVGMAAALIAAYLVARYAFDGPGVGAIVIAALSLSPFLIRRRRRIRRVAPGAESA